MSSLISSGEYGGSSEQYLDEIVASSYVESSENIQAPPAKKRRNTPGNPDPNAEVIALSPKSLLATNRFLCEVCNKGFQRDQNLQLHRRGHNLPWKLKQRTSKEIRKKVYICPEVGCIHHDPSRALGDLTGIKKHFSRKHGEKKWKCDKCSKKYAVKSDWKAHSKTCGSKEYKCDCGTLFTRRDSFITHRAFCDALAEESARTTLTSSNLTFMSPPPVMLSPMLYNHSQPLLNPQALRRQLPPWLSIDPSSIFSSPLDLNGFTNPENELTSSDQNSSPKPSLEHYQPTSSPHMSATALLQKAAQMGATAASSNARFALNTCSFEGKDLVHEDSNIGPLLFESVKQIKTNSQLIQDMINSPFVCSSYGGHTGTTFCGLLSSKKEEDFHFLEEGMTKDFLGLRPITNSDLLTFGQHVSDHDQEHHAQNYGKIR